MLIQNEVQIRNKIRDSNQAITIEIRRRGESINKFYQIIKKKKRKKKKIKKGEKEKI